MALTPFTRTYTSGKPLPFLKQMPGESAQELHARRVAAASAEQVPAATATAAKPALGEATRAAFQRAIAQYQPGGGFGAGTEAALERGRTKTVAGGQQALVSAGLAGTTMMAAPGQRFEEEIATPARMGVEEERARRLSDLEVALAMAEERGYESTEERALRERLAGGQLGLGYAQLGLGQEQLGFEREQFESGQAERNILARLALERQRTSSKTDIDYGFMAPGSVYNLSPQGRIGSAFQRLESYYS